MRNLFHTLGPIFPETVHTFWVLLWLVVVSVLFIGVLVLTCTRWGRSQPLRICVLLSLLAHVLLAGYAATIRITAARAGEPTADIEISLGETADPESELHRRAAPWERMPGQPLAAVQPVAVDRWRPQLVAAVPDRDPGLVDEGERPTPPPVAADLPTGGATAATQIETPAPASPQMAVQPSMTAPPAARRPPRSDAADDPSDGARATPPDLPALHALVPEVSAADADNPRQPASAAPPTAAPQTGDPSPAASPSSAAASTPNESGGPGAPADTDRRPPAAPAVPDLYHLRFDEQRAALARRRGGTGRAEQAVRAGLKWLAAAQDPDGRWDASGWGAGGVADRGPHQRQQAGVQADTGVTGLALLAFLGAGHTHHQAGPYRENVQRGLEYLINQQTADGNLAGQAGLFAAMYCHGMATFALGEAYAISGDERLEGAVRRAVAYTLDGQHPTTGGWRYQRGDLGDTSQLGWQVMALKSAEVGGITIPEGTWQRVQQFLSRVSSGQYGGLAAYRPGHGPSRAMTAEALVCRQLLGSSPNNPVEGEAVRFLLEEPPWVDREGQERMNFYYWYYATLALYPRQDAVWERWNAALQQALLETQLPGGPDAGSWSPNTVWGGYGGRVYTTALATLCLEVYYRYLPTWEAARVE